MSQEIRYVSAGVKHSIFCATDDAHAPQLIAKHVMNLHMNRPNAGGETGDAEGEINLDKMKRYIAYCKSYVAAGTRMLMWSVR
jgi:DNA replicative helicase MCM subunit Mcm2 (Cdc46/Mcm family)